MANYLIEERRIPTLFLTAPDLLGSLREAIRASVEGRSGDSSAMLAAAQEAPVLILDDLGAERWTEWAEEQIFLLLDYRQAGVADGGHHQRRVGDTAQPHLLTAGGPGAV